MKYINRIALVFLVLVFMISCKNDKNPNTIIENNEDKMVEEMEVIPEKLSINNSVLMKAMMTPELETFNRALVTAELTGLLSKEQGPFTIFAPSTEAFNNIPKDKMNFYLSPKNREDFIILLKNHIIEGQLDSAVLLQSIKSNGGSYEFKNLNGGILLATLKNDDLFVADSLGYKAKIGKSDINGDNGVVHIVDVVLGVPK
jgi:uncharacterized surface protein with fasciclin (FAS1) repeats